MPPQIANQRRDAIGRNKLDDLHFGWAGRLEPGRIR
jgi:hypothetical protein